jgi:hypothetical protein
MVKVIKRVIIELNEDGDIEVREEGYKSPEESMKLIHDCLSQLYGEEVVLMREKDNIELRKMMEEKGKELNTLATFINSLLILRKMGMLDMDVLETLRSMRDTYEGLSPEDRDKLDNEGLKLFKEIAEEEKEYKKLFSDYSGKDRMYGK